jgi:phosphate/sulfate permease
MTSLIITLVLLATVAFITGNNSAILSGPYRSVVILRKIASPVILLGTILGLLIEGNKLRKFTETFPIHDQNLLTIILVSIIILILLGNRYRIPISLTMTLAGGVVGIFISLGRPLDTGYLSLLLIAWITYPLLGLVISSLIYLLVKRLLRESNWRGYISEKVLLMSTTGALAYVFGANTLGLIYYLGEEGFIQTILFVIMVVGGFFLLSGGVSYEIGLKIYNISISALLAAQFATVILIEVATQFGIPVSLTQLMMISLIGPALTKKFRIINIQYLKKMLFLWAASPVIGAGIAVFLYLAYLAAI